MKRADRGDGGLSADLGIEEDSRLLTLQAAIERGSVYQFFLNGISTSKKNSYRPHRGGFHKDSNLQSELNDLESQVPGNVRDLNLKDPDMTFKFKQRNGRRDRDGLLTTVLDVLVRCKVIEDDRISVCNGRIVIEPAEICDEDSVEITIEPKL